MSGLLIVGELRDGRLADITAELIGAASELKPSFGSRLDVALIGGALDQPAAEANLGAVDEIILIEAPADFDAAVHEEALAGLITEREPALILAGHTVTSLAFASALAARLGLGFAADVHALTVHEGEIVATRSSFGGKVNVELDFPGKSTVLCMLRGATFKPAANPGAAVVTRRRVDLSAVEGAAHHLAYEPAPAAEIDLAKAEFVLSIGRGVPEEAVARFVALADRLGAVLGCSRPVADAGWLPKLHQVGQSGTIAKSCRLYIALGISGASQHLAGMKHVETIIAVNTDPGAPIFNVAHWGACLDVLELASALETLPD